MRSKIVCLIMFILVLNLRLKAEINLKKTDEWKSDYLVHGEYRGSFINENNELIIMFFKLRNKP